MTDTSIEAGEGAPKKSKLGLLIGVLLAVIGGAGGFFVTSSGMFSGESSAPAKQVAYAGDVAFVPVDPMTISIGPPADNRYLRFRAELEVKADKKADVETLLPRVVDVLNTYLCSISMADVEDPSALLTLRSQMRRRIDLVVGEDKVNDLLVMEFVVN